jgi:hypothetical protein
VDVFIGTAVLSRNVGEDKYVSNRMDGMPDMSRVLYLLRDGEARAGAARLHLPRLGDLKHRLIAD